MDLMNITLFCLSLLSKFKRIVLYIIGLYKNKLPLFLSISNPNVSDYLSNALVNIPKFPNQISIILQEDINMDSLADIMLWSFSTGVSCISIFDVKGDITYMKNNLSSRILKKLKYYNITLPIVLYSISEKTKILSITNELLIIILDKDSPKSMIVNAAKTLCHKEGNIEISDIDQYFKKYTYIDCPELTINFGTDCSIVGLMPWQSGSTELIFYPTHHHISISNYIDLLSNYASRNQRWGK